MSIPVIAIFDIGKTNKKLFLFDRQYRIVYEQTRCFGEITDEDGDACEDLDSLRRFMLESLVAVSELTDFSIRAINFSAYGASFVYLDQSGRPLTPLYSYLKPFPSSLQRNFYDSYGGEAVFSKETASPVLGSLNSGLQLYRLKMKQPAVFAQVKYALHLPQYLRFLLSGTACSDITSLGCHTGLWDFGKHDYHDWVIKENILTKLAPLMQAHQTVEIQFNRRSYRIGSGLHDSSAALIPYLVHIQEPFLLISTGTWCISLNPFNHSGLTDEQLRRDCLCYLGTDMRPVKASRIFAGHEHEEQVKRIASYFTLDGAFYRSVDVNPVLLNRLRSKEVTPFRLEPNACSPASSGFESRDLSGFASGAEAYHQLMIDMARQQYESSALVLENSPVKYVFVDGGFALNPIYMYLLSSFFPSLTIYASSMTQATSLGAALAIHDSWNDQPIPANLINVHRF